MDLSWLLDHARIEFCERRLPGLIKYPADTWTNIGPFIAGILIIRHASLPLERLLGVASLWTGIASAILHASDTILGETLDLSGMFMFILSISALQQYRSSKKQSPSILTMFVIGGTILLTILSTMSTVLASPLFAVICILVMLRGVYDRRLGPWAWAMVGSFLVAWGFWWLDFLHILCIPDNHILTGHGVWHLLNGLVFWFTFLHFRETQGGWSEKQSLVRE